MNVKYKSNVCRRCCKNGENAVLFQFVHNPDLIKKYEYVFNKKVISK